MDELTSRLRIGPEHGAERIRVAAELLRITDRADRLRTRLQQQVIDREVRATRRLLLTRLRRRLNTRPQALADDEFLAVADTTTVLDAILTVAIVTGPTDGCDLQLYDPRTGTLRIARQHASTLIRGPLSAVRRVAGSHAVHAHLLHDDAGRLLGVLSFHADTALPTGDDSGRDRELVARSAALALSRLPGLADGTPPWCPTP